ncbi:(2Fe-2S) ferredoxin domain-containing protein [Mesobacillus zeae]|uniref:(2Fe-2S) ferredoxin domain-containing protein n=1 Tax=Mesobacillus zeae TaxID=1917180 RepID=A0A398B887_9BACI|nr:(2Fe-2S) ferredoxin domain-containing protein [Mesobacillus zeae]RID86329.1 (2Fe-2S) ferredoxin domain-containing protein [Mesobacillus zeae]
MTTWNLSGVNSHILICNGSSCMRKGGEEVTEAIRREIAELNLDSRIHTTRTRCNGRCKDACIVIEYPEGTWYKEMTPELGRRLARNHIESDQGLHDSVLYSYEDSQYVQISSESEKGKDKPIKVGG